MNCADCNSHNVTSTIEDEEIGVLINGDIHYVSIKVEVFMCGDCETRFTTEAAEIIRDEAVKNLRKVHSESKNVS